MIQLARHIEILLLDNDCVIVPGLGGFMAHHIPAKYYADTQAYLPPLRQLGFNAQLQINDSLLAQSYIEAYDISYPEALRRIASEVEELRQVLKECGRCELNDIGVLRQDIDGRMEFLPCEAGILTPTLYGLDGVACSPSQHVDMEANAPSHKERGASAPRASSIREADASRSTADSSPLTPHSSLRREVPDQATITIRVSTLRNIAVAAAVVVALFVCAIPFGKLQQPELTRSYIDTGVLYRISHAGLEAHDHSQHVARPRRSQVVKDSAHVGLEARAPRGEEHFFSIVLASCLRQASAEAFVNALRRAGYDKAETAERSNGVKVIYGRFATRGEAQTFLTRLRSHAPDFDEGWVMEF